MGIIRQCNYKGEIKMDTTKAARELGKVIQKDERYSLYHKAKQLNDADTTLQDLIGEFNLLRQELTALAGSDDQEKINALNTEAQAAYAKIMDNENMKNFTAAKLQMDAMITQVSTIISLCCEGEDPDTCQIEPVSGCSSGGGCSGCGKH
jgi:cell fate (sporulation/competence/biofilm development) regulator YlbF (YheA/YmcA/DUF963 family)